MGQSYEVGRATGQTIRKCRVKGLVSSSNGYFNQSIVACKRSSVSIVVWMRQLDYTIHVLDPCLEFLPGSI